MVYPINSFVDSHKLFIQAHQGLGVVVPEDIVETKYCHLPLMHFDHTFVDHATLLVLNKLCCKVTKVAEHLSCVLYQVKQQLRRAPLVKVLVVLLAKSLHLGWHLGTRSELKPSHVVELLEESLILEVIELGLHLLLVGVEELAEQLLRAMH